MRRPGRQLATACRMSRTERAISDPVGDWSLSPDDGNATLRHPRRCVTLLSSGAMLFVVAFAIATK